MDRKQFLKTCAGGFCACAAATGLAGAAETEDATKEDWRLPFVKQRYAKLMNILEQKMGEDGASEALQELGDFCCSQQDETARKYRGNVEGFAKFIGGHGSTVTHDAERNVYTLSYNPGSACPCPFAGEVGKTPELMCECSIGWARHSWRIVLDRDVKVALKESFLRGGKVCKFEITPV